MGLDPLTLSALEMPPATYDAIALEAVKFVRENPRATAPLLTQWMDRREHLWEAKSPEAVATHSDALEADRTAIRQAAAGFATSLATTLDTDVQEAFTRAADNAALDPILRLVPLDSGQKEPLMRATLGRDAVIHNPYNWCRRSVTASAWEEYGKQCEAVLTADQAALYEAYKARAATNFAMVLEREQAVLATIRESEAKPREPVFDRLFRRPWRDIIHGFASLAIDPRFAASSPVPGAWPPVPLPKEAPPTPEVPGGSR
jgi:hypothetical protein